MPEYSVPKPSLTGCCFAPTFFSGNLIRNVGNGTESGLRLDCKVFATTPLHKFIGYIYILTPDSKE